MFSANYSDNSLDMPLYCYLEQALAKMVTASFVSVRIAGSVESR